MKTLTGVITTLGAIGFLALGPAAAFAETGFYAGGSVGGATVDANISDPDLPDNINFNEDDFAWKVFGGFQWDPWFIDLGVEVGYVDFGKPSSSLVEIDASGWNIWGVGAFDLGPVGIFGKLGYIAWDADASLRDTPFTSSDDGSDIGYGIGAKFELWSLQFRAEYEIYDIEDTDDVSMYSVGVAWIF
jgi:hypothetical protein